MHQIAMPRIGTKEPLIKYEFQLGSRTGEDARAYIDDLTRGSLSCKREVVC